MPSFRAGESETGPTRDTIECRLRVADRLIAYPLRKIAVISPSTVHPAGWRPGVLLPSAVGVAEPAP